MIINGYIYTVTGTTEHQHENLTFVQISTHSHRTVRSQLEYNHIRIGKSDMQSHSHWKK